MTERYLTESQAYDLIRREMELKLNRQGIVAQRFTQATRPSAKGNAGALIFVSDYGGAEPVLAMSDGNGNWRRFQPAGTLESIPAWASAAGAPATATFVRDYLNDYIWMADDPTPFEGITRASTALMAGSDDIYDEFAANVLRRQNNVGALIEDESTNYFYNNSWGGASVGVVGSGGSLPTGMGTSGWDSVEIKALASTESDGLDYIDIEFKKDNSGGGSPVYPNIYDSFGITAAAQNDEFACDLSVIVVADNATSIAPSIWELDGGYSYLTGGSGSAIAGDGRYTHSRTLTDASTAFAEWALAWTVNAGVNCTTRLKIAAAKLESGLVTTSPIITTSGSVMRASDAITWGLGSTEVDLTFTFDNDTTQTIAGVSGSYTLDPADLNRSTVKYVWGVPA